MSNPTEQPKTLIERAENACTIDDIADVVIELCRRFESQLKSGGAKTDCEAAVCNAGETVPHASDRNSPAADSLPPLDLAKLKPGTKLVAIRDSHGMFGSFHPKGCQVEYDTGISGNPLYICVKPSDDLDRFVLVADFRLASPPPAPPVAEPKTEKVQFVFDERSIHSLDDLKKQGVKLPPENTPAPREGTRMTKERREEIALRNGGDPDFIECLDEIDALEELVTARTSAAEISYARTKRLEAENAELKSTLAKFDSHGYYRQCLELKPENGQLKSKLDAIQQQLATRESERQLALVGEKMWKDEAQKAIAGVARHRKALEEKEAELSALKSARSNQEPFTHIWTGSPSVKTPLYLHPDPRLPAMVERIKAEVLEVLNDQNTPGWIKRRLDRIYYILSEFTPSESKEKKQ